VPPEALATIRPDAVIVLNPLYRSEIGEAVERLGIAADVVTVDVADGRRVVGPLA
jgi:hypothetical protein